jgi:hypothetical protein
MKDAYEVLYQKETDLVRVRQEVESLRVAASLLSDDTTLAGEGESPESQEKKPAENAPASEAEGLATGTNGTGPGARQPGLWEAFTRKRR